MAESEVSLALVVLRAVRGWTQEELARESGIRASSVSDYERSRKIPELRTLTKLIRAMGYPLSAVERAQAAVADLQYLALAYPQDGTLSCGVPTPPAEPGTPAALRWETEQLAHEAGRLAPRLLRAAFFVLAQAGSTLLAQAGMPEEPEEPSGVEQAP